MFFTLGSTLIVRSRVWLLSALVGVLPATAALSDELAATPLVIGETFLMPSQVLQEDRRINVYLPAGYAEQSDKRYPVMFMPDGGLAEDFLHIAGLLQISALNGTMRPFILIGIENTERRRDLTGPTVIDADREIAPRVGGSSNFRSFLRDELIPRVAATYRTTNERVLIGESLAGLFVIETLLLEPELFDSYVAIDPSLWWNAEWLVQHTPELLAKGDFSTKRLALASTTATPIGDASARMADQIKRGKLAASWFIPMSGESHASIFHPAALLAFRTIEADSREH
jgi:predicted alpha/beta superfamily hydrolase